MTLIKSGPERKDRKGVGRKDGNLDRVLHSNASLHLEPVETLHFLHPLCLNNYFSLIALVAHFPIPSSNRFSLISSFLTHFLKIHRPVSVVRATEARLWTLPSRSTSCHLSPAVRQGKASGIPLLDQPRPGALARAAFSCHGACSASIVTRPFDAE